MSRVILSGIGLSVALGLSSCAPGPGGYAGWSNFRQRQANEHAYHAERDAQAAQWQAAHGNYDGAQQAQAAANAESARAQAEHDHAARDRFLSQF